MRLTIALRGGATKIYSAHTETNQNAVSDILMRNYKTNL